MARIIRFIGALGLGLGLVSGASAAESWKKLLSPEDLSALTEASDEVRLVDLSSVKDYAQGHVPGAVNVPYNAWRGPKDNPGQLIDDAKLTRHLQVMGVEPESLVVVTYPGKDASDFGAAARVYWTIKSAGVGDVAILNGGVAAWKTAGLALSTAEPAVMPTDTEYALGAEWLLDKEGVAAVVAGESDVTLIDARPEVFFKGKKKHDAAKWAGTIGDALNLDQFSWFPGANQPGPVFEADAPAILARARAAGWSEGEPIGSFCNTGHWAATNWFALSEIAGIDDVRLYPESLVGWTRSNPEEQVAQN